MARGPCESVLRLQVSRQQPDREEPVHARCRPGCPCERRLEHAARELARCRRDDDMAARVHLIDILPHRGRGARDGLIGAAERFDHPRRLVAVPIPLGVRHRADEALIGEWDRLNQRGVYPEQQCGIFSGVTRPAAKRADLLVQGTVYRAMERIDALDRLGPPRLAAEGQRLHRPNRMPESQDRLEPTAPERTVLGNGRRDQRMRKLQQDSACPAEEHDALGVQPPRLCALKIPTVVPLSPRQHVI